MTSSKGKKGVTLIELMVVIAILGIVLSLIYSIFISQMRTSVWRVQLADRQQNCQAGMNLMIADLVKARSIEWAADICDGVISMNLPLDDTNFETITYSTDGTPASPGNLIRTSSETGKTAIVADNTTGLKITCYDRDGGEKELPVSAGDVGDVRRVAMDLSCMTSGFRPGTDERSETTISSAVQTRNIPQYAGSGCGMLYFNLSPTSVAFCNPPGQQPILSIKLCDLIGNAMAGEVSIYPKEPLPITIDGIGGTVVDASTGTAVMTVPNPGGQSCDVVAWSQAVANATDASALVPGSGLEMVASWKPTDCTYFISTSRSLSIKAGYPQKFDDTVALVQTPDLTACSGEQSEIKLEVQDNCGNPITGETVTLSIDGDPGGGIWGIIDPTTATDPGGTGTYTSVYNAGTLATTLTVRAEVGSIYNAGTELFDDTISRTGTVNVQPNVPDLLVRTTGTIVRNECPGSTSRVEFKVWDECNPRNIITDDQLQKLTASTTRGFVNDVAADGNAYYTIYNTPASCGPGTDFVGQDNVVINHSEIGDLTVPLDLDQCLGGPDFDEPVVNLSALVNKLAAGCPDKTLEFTATIWKKDCTPDAQPAWITFEVKNPLGGTGYGSIAERNGRFDDLATKLATKVEYTDTGLATADLLAWDSLPGDILWVRAIAEVVAYTWPPEATSGGATYTSDEFQVNITNSTSEVKFYEDETFTTVASFYDVPAKVPVEEVGNIFVEIRDCDENDNILATDTITATLTSDDAVGIINTTTATLAESGCLIPPCVNTGIFRVIVPIKRSAAPGTMEVDKGGFITGSYTDNDDANDKFEGAIPLTGCRELRVVDEFDNDITVIAADIFPYATGFPEGPNTFRLIANVPSVADDGITDTVTIHTCAGVGDEDTVTLGEEAGDTGMLRIDGPSLGGTHTRDYIYVGEDPVNLPQPDGDANVGLRVDSAPDIITIVFPRGTDTACNTDDQNVVNEGCSATLSVRSCREDLALNGSDNDSLVSDCRSDNRGFDYNAKFYDFSLATMKYVQMGVTSPGAGAFSFNPYMYLMGSTGSVIERDDDTGGVMTGGPLDPKIARWLKAGDYRIEATSYSASEFGDYTISLQDLTGTCNFTPITNSSTVNTAITTDCESTYFTDPYTEWYSKYFVLTIPSAMTVNVTVDPGLGWAKPHIILYNSSFNYSVDWQTTSFMIITGGPDTFYFEVLDGVSEKTWVFELQSSTL